MGNDFNLQYIKAKPDPKKQIKLANSLNNDFREAKRINNKQLRNPKSGAADLNTSELSIRNSLLLARQGTSVKVGKKPKAPNRHFSNMVGAVYSHVHDLEKEEFEHQLQ